MRVELLELNTPTIGKRLYTTEVIRDALANMKKDSILPGYIGIPVRFNLAERDAEEMAFSGNSLRIEGNTLVADIDVHAGPHGDRLLEIMGDVDFRIIGSTFARHEPNGVNTVTRFRVISIGAIPRH